MPPVKRQAPKSRGEGDGHGEPIETVEFRCSGLRTAEGRARTGKVRQGSEAKDRPGHPRGLQNRSAQAHCFFAAKIKTLLICDRWGETSKTSVYSFLPEEAKSLSTSLNNSAFKGKHFMPPGKT